MSKKDCAKAFALITKCDDLLSQRSNHTKTMLQLATAQGGSDSPIREIKGGGRRPGDIRELDYRSRRLTT